MSLRYDDGTPFAVGVQTYRTHSVIRGDEDERAFVQIKIEGVEAEAFLDTGGAWLVCTPEIVAKLGLDPRGAVSSAALGIRGVRVAGWLHRLTLTLPADRGSEHSLEVVAFAPDIDPEIWGEFPPVLGWTGCVEWFRFAVDPLSQSFYFGPAA